MVHFINGIIKLRSMNYEFSLKKKQSVYLEGRDVFDLQFDTSGNLTGFLMHLKLSKLAFAAGKGDVMDFCEKLEQVLSLNRTLFREKVKTRSVETQSERVEVVTAPEKDALVYLNQLAQRAYDASRVDSIESEHNSVIDMLFS